MIELLSNYATNKLLSDNWIIIKLLGKHKTTKSFKRNKHLKWKWKWNQSKTPKKERKKERKKQLKSIESWCVCVSVCECV